MPGSGRKRGPVEAKIHRGTNAMRREGRLAELDEAAVALAVAMARAVDEASAVGDVRAAASASGEMRQCLKMLGMQPKADAGGGTPTWLTDVAVAE